MQRGLISSLCISTDCFRSLNNMLEGNPSPTFLLFEHFFCLFPPADIFQPTALKLA